ncbi:hypothetical protein XH86_36975 (plasmid) [Bradyrhizobium guangdongense]|uniref:Uncharacterized protein n=1 Tax=Bradyrhizobium guangdongense TaxID=1325090 RepID=A0A7S7ZVM2_9BRAD|nr:hypothetical protein XH86_36975 [Bradyrhizobium guangdongense]
MLNNGFMVELRSHLSLVAANGVPVQQVRIDFVYLAKTSMSDTGGSIAVDVHHQRFPDSFRWHHTIGARPRSKRIVDRR